MPVLIAFSIAILALNALPMVLAGYREKGILRRLQTTPIGPVRLLTAQLAVNFAVTVVTVIVLLVVARMAYGVALPKQLAGFVIATLLAAAALLAVGLFVAATAGADGPPRRLGTILFFPMMFFAGLWLPIADDAHAPALHQPRHPARRGGAGSDRGRPRGTGRTRSNCWSWRRTRWCSGWPRARLFRWE